MSNQNWQQITLVYSWYCHCSTFLSWNFYISPTLEKLTRITCLLLNTPSHFQCWLGLCANIEYVFCQFDNIQHTETRQTYLTSQRLHICGKPNSPFNRTRSLRNYERLDFIVQDSRSNYRWCWKFYIDFLHFNTERTRAIKRG